MKLSKLKDSFLFANLSTQTVVAVVAVLLGGLFLLQPSKARADLLLPPTPCDTEQIDPILPGFGVSAHLISGMVKEDGATAFQYGVDNNSFVSATGTALIFHVNPLFPVSSTSTAIKLLAFDENCGIVFGIGPQFGGNTLGQSNDIAFDQTADTFTLNGESQHVSPSAIPRYIWVEVVDNLANPTRKTYSYLVDLQNPQNPTGQTVPPPALDPVIIIHGILGSWQKDGNLMIDPILHSYDDLTATLEANGYTEGATLFPFVYNWRESNVVTANLLRGKINQIKQICSCGKVDIIAHSMGGLVARQYVESDSYQGDVDQLIFLGTPQLGAPNDYLAWEGGEIGGSGLSSIVLKMILTSEGKKQGYSDLYNYIRNKPISSVQELLPIYNYLRDKDIGIRRTYPDNYPRNAFLENLENNLDRLTSSEIRITNITGDKGSGSTVNFVRVVQSPNPPKWADGYPDGFYEKQNDRGLELGAGDGTVPKISSEHINVDPHSFTVDHQAIPGASAGLIYQTLTGNTPSTVIHNHSFPDVMLIIKMLSPADMLIVAPDGKKIGKDFQSNQELDEIPGAFYSGFQTDDELVTIPNPIDGEYKVITQGTGNGGEYTVATGYATDADLLEKDFIAQTAPGLISDLTVTVNNENPQDLSILADDKVPPAISIISPQAQDYIRSATIPINVEIVDTGTGVQSSQIEYDDRVVASGDLIDPFYEKLGDHKLRVMAQDFIVNTSTAEVSFRIIATINSTISDVDRAYSQGWIKNKKIKDGFMKTLLLAGRVKRGQKLVLLGFLTELHLANRRGLIKDQAYQILSDDILWLIKH